MGAADHDQAPRRRRAGHVRTPPRPAGSDWSIGGRIGPRIDQTVDGTADLVSAQAAGRARTRRSAVARSSARTRSTTPLAERTMRPEPFGPVKRPSASGALLPPDQPRAHLLNVVTRSAASAGVSVFQRSAR